jgi:hypothetical protein
MADPGEMSHPYTEDWVSTFLTGREVWVTAEEITIGDPAKCAWQAGRVLGLGQELARSDAVRSLRFEGKSWSEVGRLLVVSRGRAHPVRLGQLLDRPPRPQVVSIRNRPKSIADPSP